ncbi:hypothetical protein SMQE21_02610 [Serratia marcescens]|nr:hypothetical protein SMQE21_02610 [Serratia marcescens]
MLVRECYEVFEIKSKLGCTEKDILYLASKGDVDIGFDFTGIDNESLFINKVYVREESVFNDWLLSAKTNRKGYRHVSGGSYLEIHSDLLRVDDFGVYFTAYLKGYWVFDDDYVYELYDKHLEPEDWPAFFLGDLSTGNGSCVIRAVPIYDDEKDYMIPEFLHVSKESYIYLSKIFSKNNDNYKEQSESQIERHSKPRVDILMALLSLVRKEPKLLNLNATKLAEKLYENAAIYWPATKELPLGFDAVRELISNSFRK